MGGPSVIPVILLRHHSEVTKIDGLNNVKDLHDHVWILYCDSI